MRYARRMIASEVVRGRTPPPWVLALDGLERVRWYSLGKLPVTPMGRLLGYRITHVVPGGATLTIPASQALVGGNGQLGIAPLVTNALVIACCTAAAPAVVARPLSVATSAFRPARAQPGNLVAHARVVNVSRLFVFAETHVEDAEGRSIAHGSMHAALERMPHPPPEPPTETPRVEEPVYETPDPYLRSYPMEIATLPFGERDGLELIRHAIEHRLSDPVMTLFGVELQSAERGHVVLSAPASEWLCNTEAPVSVSALAAIISLTGWCAGQTLHTVGKRLAALDETVRFLRDVVADGRPLRAEARVAESAGGLRIARTTMHDADGNLVATHEGALVLVDGAPDPDRARRKPERVLATLLFTDIVGSTEHAGRVGDAAWHALLAAHHLIVRREISRYNGTEVDTAGDGVFARFDSPARAIEAARAVRAAAARQQLEIRAGIHTGECEIEGNTLRGIAVHLAARVQTAAAPGEILVSSTVRDLASGGDVAFADRGEHELKGIPGPRRLFAVLDR
jgi:class 3 adenylate cyclase